MNSILEHDRDKAVIFIEDCTLFVLFLSIALLFSFNLQIHFTLPKLFALQAASLFLSLLWIVRLFYNNFYQISHAIFINIILLCCWWLYTTYNAIHIQTAVDGYYGRYNGLNSHIIYLLLFLSLSSSRFSQSRIRKILLFFMLSIAPVAVIAILQSLNILQNPFGDGRTISTTGNPVILASLLSLTISVICYFIISSSKKILQAIYCCLLFVFLTGIFSTLSRWPIIALALSTILFCWLSFFKIKKLTSSNKLIVSVIFISLLIIFVFFFYSRIEFFIDRIQSIFSQGDTSVNARKIYILAAISAIKDHWFNGIGFENFRNIYPKYRTIDDNVFTDILPTMVHNNYLQTFLDNGIFGLVLYLSIIAFIFIELVKTYRASSEEQEKLLSATFIAIFFFFLLYDLAGWEEVSFTPFFWIFAGITISFTSQYNKTAKRYRWLIIPIAISGFCFLSFLCIDGYNKLRIDKLYWKAQHLNVLNHWNKIESTIKQADQYSADSYLREDQKGVIYLNRLKATGEKDAYLKCVAAFETAHDYNKNDPYVLIHRIEADVVGLRKKIISEASVFALNSVFILKELDKNNATCYHMTAMLSFMQRKYHESLSEIKTAMLLRPSNALYYILAGDCYGALREHNNAVNEYKKAIAMLGNTQTQTLLLAKYGLIINLIYSFNTDEALHELEDALRYFPAEKRLILLKQELNRRNNNAH